ncbi:MAG TPA: cobalamin biosynthesis protein, partial [Polyangiaceae bacterium]|nr:cobalamin biosynthesis protein [Polyangiaceae bacterium]
MSSARRSFAIYAITRHGVKIAQRLLPALPGADLLISERLRDLAPDATCIFPLPMGPLLAETFKRYDAHVFVISVGAVVRLIAPLLENKKVDPAVICVDDASRYAICVLSGHVGRGNAFTERVASALDAQAIVTTASDSIGTLTVDILGRELGWNLDDPDRNVTRACAAVVNAERVLFVQESGEPEFWPLNKTLPPGVHYTTSLEGVEPSAWDMLLIASHRDLARTHPRHFRAAVVYRPKSLVLGIGCDRDTPLELIERGIQHVFAEHGLCTRCIQALASIDKKADEPALLRLAAARGWPFQTYTAGELARLGSAEGVRSPSDTVQRFVGSPGVCEPAALLRAGAKELLVPKQKYTEPGAGRSMTLAVAEVPFMKRVAALNSGTDDPRTVQPQNS